MYSVVDSDLLQAAFEALPFEVALLDTTGEILFVNEVWKSFGDNNSSTHDSYWVGENYLTICKNSNGSIATAVANGLGALLAGDQNDFQLEYPCHPPAGQRWFLLEATAVTYNNARYAIVTHIDITARKQAELQRKIRTEQLETIVSILSHDLRNPLSIIQGYAEELSTQDVDTETVTAIQESADRMAELIDTTLKFARTQSVDDLSQVSLEDIATDAWAQTPTADASLEIEARRPFMADKQLLHQLFENLFRNAVEHGGSSVTVWVGTTTDGIYIEDNGSGIPAVKRDQLQERDVSHDSKTGLGLAIVRAIVIAHDWSFAILEGRENGTRIVISGIHSDINSN